MNPTSTNYDPSNVNKEAEASWQSRPKTTGTVRFLSPHPKYENEKPFILSIPLPKDQPKSNAIYDTHDIKIADARGDERSFSLDQQGFEFVEIPSLPTAVSSKEAIEGDYLPQMERFLKEHLKANRVIAFDHVVNHFRPHCPGCINRLMRQCSSAKSNHLVFHTSGRIRGLQPEMHILVSAPTPRCLFSRSLCLRL